MKIITYNNDGIEEEEDEDFEGVESVRATKSIGEVKSVQKSFLIEPDDDSNDRPMKKTHKRM